MTVDFIKSEYLKGKSQRYSETKNKEVKSFIEESITIDISHKEKVFCFINNSMPKCKNPLCNKIPGFINFNSGYKDYCSISCSVICSKENQEKTRILHIQEKVKDLSTREIIEGLYSKNIKIQKWRDIEKLNHYTNFKTLEQVYKHVILKENQICMYCNKVFDINKKTKESRNCICRTKSEKLLLDFNGSNDEFIKMIKKYNLLYNLKIHKHKDLLEQEYLKRFKMLPWVKSINENIYCIEHNIKEKPCTEFIDILKGYKNSEIKIDYSKSNKSILIQFKKKYTNKGFYTSFEFLDFLNPIKEKYSLHSNLETVYFIENDLIQVPRCKICNNKVKFNLNSKEYSDYCSVKCSNKGESSKRKIITRENFIKNKLPLILEQNEVELQDEYISMHHRNKFKCNKCNKIFYRNFSNKILCDCKKISWCGFSNQEKEVLTYIESIYNGEILPNDRHLGIELDIYIPNLKLGIEYNGMYWHSDEFKEKNYHLNKTEICNKNKIKLIHIFEDEWLNKTEIIKNILKNEISKELKIKNIKNTSIKEINIKINKNKINKFIKRYSIKNISKFDFAYGFYINKVLVEIAVLTRNSLNEIEINFIKNIQYSQHAQGIEKLIKYIKNIHKGYIILLLDRRYFNEENEFKNIGKFIGYTDIDFKQINENKIFDCGNLIYHI